MSAAVGIKVNASTADDLRVHLLNQLLVARACGANLSSAHNIVPVTNASSPPNTMVVGTE
jgi:hypothetical protein